MIPKRIANSLQPGAPLMHLLNQRSEMSEEQTGARAYGRMHARYGFSEVHQFTPNYDDSSRCRHCGGTAHNVIHWSI